MSASKLKIIEDHGKRLAVLAFTDLDGTVNNQEVPESERLATINPAKEAIQQLQNNGIPVGIVTARSFGETLVYKNALGADGFTITEDGAVIILPQYKDQDIGSLSRKDRLVSHRQQSALILSKVGLSKIKEFINYIDKKLKKIGYTDDLATTCTSTPEVLKRLVKYETVDDAKRAIDRLASAFIRDTTESQYKVIKENSAAWNIRVGGRRHHLQIVGEDADKGGALKFINDNINLFFPPSMELRGIFPIVFGNDHNDLRLFEEAHKLGGTGILVQNSAGNYNVSDDDIPDYVIRAEGAGGYGMKKSIEKLLKSYFD